MPRNPHPLVAAWIEEKRRGRAVARQYGWPEEPYEITKRILCAYDRLFKAAEKRGHTVAHEARYLRPAWLLIAKERIDIDVREKISQRRIPLTAAELKDPLNVALNRRWKQTREPAGTLLLDASAPYRIKHKCRWEDQPGRPLEQQIEAILAGMEEIAAAVAATRKEDAERENRQWEEARRRERRQALEARADRRFRVLRDEAAAWREAESLRKFVDAVAGRMGDAPSIRTSAWLKWARARINDLDPMSASQAHLSRTLMARRPHGSSIEEDAI